MFLSAKNSEASSSTCLIKLPENEVFIKNFGPLVEGVILHLSSKLKYSPGFIHKTADKKILHVDVNADADARAPSVAPEVTHGAAYHLPLDGHLRHICQMRHIYQAK